MKRASTSPLSDLPDDSVAALPNSSTKAPKASSSSLKPPAKKRRLKDDSDDDDKPLAKAVKPTAKARASLGTSPLPSTSSKPAAGTSKLANEIRPAGSGAATPKGAGVVGGQINDSTWKSLFAGVPSMKKKKEPAAKEGAAPTPVAARAATPQPTTETPTKPINAPAPVPAPAIRSRPAPPELDYAGRQRLKQEAKQCWQAVESSSFDLLRQSLEMKEYDDYLGNQRKVWNGDWPLDAAQQPPMIAAGQRVSVRQGDPPSLPYPMQFGAGFWLCSESNAPALSPNGV